MNINRSAFIGPILIVFGIFLFLKGDVLFHTSSIFKYFWPTLFVIPLGVFFQWLYFFVLNRRGVGLLVPGGILLTAGIVSQIAMLLDSWGTMWPGFIFAVVVGLFQLYWFGGRNKWLLIPINILGVLSLLFFAVFSIGAFFGSLFGSQPIIAGALIFAGLVIMFMRRNHSL